MEHVSVDIHSELKYETSSLPQEYGNRVDPVSALGLDEDSIFCYLVEDVVRAPNLSHPELLPYGYCVGDVDTLQVWLKVGIGSEGVLSQYVLMYV